MSQLIIKLDNLKNPYSSDVCKNLEAWGKIGFYIETDQTTLELLNWQWDVLCLIDWYLINKEDLFGYFFFGLCGNESLADALRRLRDVDFEDHEADKEFKWHTELYEYWSKHSLRAALRGANIPDIIIGRKKSNGEISLSEDMANWSYQFDLSKFSTQFKKEVIKFIKEWKGLSSDPRISKYETLITDQLFDRNGAS